MNCYKLLLLKPARQETRELSRALIKRERRIPRASGPSSWDNVYCLVRRGATRITRAFAGINRSRRATIIANTTLSLSLPFASTPGAVCRDSKRIRALFRCSRRNDRPRVGLLFLLLAVVDCSRSAGNGRRSLLRGFFLLATASEKRYRVLISVLEPARTES